MPVKPRKVVSAQGGRHSKSLCDSKFATHSKSLKAHTPQIWGVTIHPPNLGGESSKITCFTVFFEGHFLNLGGEIFTPQIWGVWVFRDLLRHSIFSTAGSLG